MILEWSKVRIFVKPGGTDMRKQINGLSLIVTEELQKDIFEGHLYLFCNKSRRLLKIIYWDKKGFCLWLKRLERDKFPWPQNQTDALEITSEQFGFLLSGIDFWNAHKKLDFRKIS